MHARGLWNACAHRVQRSANLLASWELVASLARVARRRMARLTSTLCRGRFRWPGLALTWCFNGFALWCDTGPETQLLHGSEKRLSCQGALLTYTRTNRCAILVCIENSRAPAKPCSAGRSFRNRMCRRLVARGLRTPAVITDGACSCTASKLDSSCCWPHVHTAPGSMSNEDDDLADYSRCGRSSLNDRS